MADVPRFTTVDDYEPLARERLAADLYDFYAGGAGDEWTLAENRRAFDRWVLRPRVLRGAGRPDPSTSILGTPVLPGARGAAGVPVHGASRRHVGDGTRRRGSGHDHAGLLDGDRRAGGRRGGGEEGGRGVGGPRHDAPKWWQVYVFEDRGETDAMLARVMDAGYDALCLTVDVPILGLRHRDTRHGFGSRSAPASRLSFDAMLSWDDLAWIRERTRVPLAGEGHPHGRGRGAGGRGGRRRHRRLEPRRAQLDGSPAGLRRCSRWWTPSPAVSRS